MNSNTNSKPTPHTVSTVTKHIKIYSDNPIHDCIDRIIDICVALDEGKGDSLRYAEQLKEAAQIFSDYAFDLFVKECHKRHIERDEKRPN